MILRALYDYYNRCKETLAPEGFEDKRIDFIIRIDEEGRFLGLKDNRKGKTYFVEKTPADRTSTNYVPNSFWGNAQYVLNISDNGDNPRHKNFIARVDELTNEYGNISFMAVKKFYESGNGISKIQSTPQWNEIVK
jgi:CRISPR-associated protein Csd1